jgi:5'-nucleotidase
MDTYINAWAPDASYGDRFNFSVRQPGVMSGLVQFDLSSIPQFAGVHDAQLKLYPTYRTNVNQLNLYAYPVVGPWDEGVTWNTAPATSYSAAAMTTLRGVDMEVTLDVTAQVQDWVNEPDSNYGLMLKADDSKSVKYTFIASDFSWESAGPPYPMLEVTYTPPVEITILHNNDGESDLLPDGDFGGVARFASVVDRVRTEVGDTHPLLLVTSGDNFLAGPQWTASLQKGVPFYDSIAMDLIGYDAMCIGNHDFDFGPDTLADFIEGFTASQVPFMSANLDFAAEPRLQALEDAGRIAASVIIEAGDEQFGIVGATTPNLTFISSPRNVVVGQDVQAAVQAEIDALEAAGVNKIILISHLQGIEEDIALAPQLSGVDVMIAGGGDELLANPGDLLVPGDEGDIYGPYPIVVQNADGADVPVVTTSGQYKYLGDLEVAFDGDGNLIFFEGGPIRVAGGAEPDAVEPDPDVQAQVEDPVTAFVAGLAENVIAGSEVGLDARRDFIRSRETNEGNLTTDSFLWKATQLHADFGAPAPDIAMCNGGGIRNDSIIPAGDFTELDTFDMLPFPNFLTIVFSFVYDSRLEAGNRVSYVALNDGTVIIEGGAVAPTARDIHVAIVDFLARGGDEYFGGPPGRDDFFILGASYQQALADYIQAPAAEGGLEGLISAAQYPEGGEGRITNLAIIP